MLGCSLQLVGAAWTVDPCYNDIVTSAFEEEQHMLTAAQSCTPDAEACRDSRYGIFDSEDVYVTPVEEDDPDIDVKPSGMRNHLTHVPSELIWLFVGTALLCSCWPRS